MPQYLIYFNQQWVGDHDEAWFEGRVEPSTAVLREMQPRVHPALGELRQHRLALGKLLAAVPAGRVR